MTKKLGLQLLCCWLLIQLVLYFCTGKQNTLICSILLGAIFLAFGLKETFKLARLKPIDLPFSVRNFDILIIALYLILASALTLISAVVTHISPAHSFRLHFVNISKSTIWIETLILAPIYEEVFFRGSILSKMQHIFSNPSMAQNTENSQKSENANTVKNSSLFAIFKSAQTYKLIYLNALVFWFFHIPLEQLAQGNFNASPGSFLLGLVCSAITLVSQRVVFAILLHSLANGLGFVWEYVFSALGIDFLFPYFFNIL